jgi:hypothetical protein
MVGFGFVLKYAAMCRSYALIAALFIVPSVARSQVTEQNAPAVMAEVARQNYGWNQKSNSPGVSINVTEVSRSQPHRIYYQLSASGFPPNLKYTIATWPANRLTPTAGMTGVTLDASGIAVCAGTPGTCKGDGPNSPIHMQFSPVKSEPIRVSLVSEDEKHLRAFISLVPIPNRVTDKQCSLEEVMLAPFSALIAVQGSGYELNSDIQFFSESEGEHHDGQIKSDSDGNFYLPMGLGVKGKEKGVTKLSVVSQRCSLSLLIPWGKESYQYE